MGDELATESMDIIVSALDKNAGNYDVGQTGSDGSVKRPADDLRLGTGGLQADQGDHG